MRKPSLVFVLLILLVNQPRASVFGDKVETPFDPPSDTDAMRRVTKLTRDASIGRRLRHKGQPDGEVIDIDAAIALTIERRAGYVSEPRVYQRDAPVPRRHHWMLPFR